MKETSSYWQNTSQRRRRNFWHQKLNGLLCVFLGLGESELESKSMKGRTCQDLTGDAGKQEQTEKHIIKTLGEEKAVRLHSSK